MVGSKITIAKILEDTKGMVHGVEDVTIMYICTYIILYIHFHPKLKFLDENVDPWVLLTAGVFLHVTF